MVNERQRLRTLAISEIKDLFAKSLPETKEDVNKLVLVIQSKYKVSRRAALEYVSVAKFELHGI